MKLLRTFILGITILVLVPLNYFFLKKSLSYEVPKPKKAEYAEHSVFKIEIQSKTAHIVIKKSRNDNWEIVRPFSWPANSFAVREFLQTLKQNPSIPPDMTITLEKKGHIEKITNANSQSIDPSLKKRLDEMISSDILFWCQQKICPLASDEIVQLELVFHETNQQFFLSQRSFSWHFNRPIEIEADTLSVQKIIEWIVNLEVLPLTEDKFRTSVFCENDSAFSRKPYVTITLTNSHQKRFSIICGYFLKEESSEIIHYAWLDNHLALFPITWREELERPMQSLCIQSLFPKIKSVTSIYGDQKLFLSCNESGEWSVFKFSKETQCLELLENFDVQSLLLFLSLMKPLDIISKTKIPDVISGEKFLLEINGNIKFEIFIEENKAYLSPTDKSYAIAIDENLWQKLFRMICSV